MITILCFAPSVAKAFMAEALGKRSAPNPARLMFGNTEGKSITTFLVSDGMIDVSITLLLLKYELTHFKLLCNCHMFTYPPHFDPFFGGCVCFYVAISFIQSVTNLLRLRFLYQFDQFSSNLGPAA